MLIPFFVSDPRHAVGAYNISLLSRVGAVGAVYGLLIGLYWSTQHSALVQLLPRHRLGKYTGLFSALKTVTNAFGPSVYAGIAQWQNSHLMALTFSIVPFMFLSLIPLYLTDFARGTAQAQEEENNVKVELTSPPRKISMWDSLFEVVMHL